MAASGLFEDWAGHRSGRRVVEGTTKGPAVPMATGRTARRPERSEHPPFTNSVLVADNNRMHHRIGQIGDLGAAPRALSAAAKISRHADGGWTVSDTGNVPVRYDDRDFRISILWKAQIRPAPEHDTAAPLAP
jgi:hypothetical protein